VEAGNFFLEAVVVVENVLAEERQNVRVVVKVVFLVYSANLTFRTYQLPLLAMQLSAVMVLFPDLALRACLEGGLDDLHELGHSEVSK